MAACGDGRDRSRYWHGRHLHEQIWAHYNHQDAPDKTFLLLLLTPAAGPATQRTRRRALLCPGYTRPGKLFTGVIPSVPTL